MLRLRKCFSSPSTIYYGLDGDDTGKILEELFITCSDEKRFKDLSESVNKAISKIADDINKTNKASIIFKAGDDVLFKGNLQEKKLLEIKKTYSQLTSGLTCSIGYGRSFQEVYLALKRAKTQPRKNSIVGIKLC